MKKIIAVLLLICLCVSLVGCKVLDYKEATERYAAGDYAGALEIYRQLGDYADSAAMAQICWQKADYVAAEALYVAGDYAQALPLYEGLVMYADSPVKAIYCRYEIGKSYLEEKNYAEAISWLSALGNYENSGDLVHQARWQWLHQSRQTIVLKDEESAFQAISLEPMQDGGMRIFLENEGLLLGLPYETEFTMVLMRGNPKAAYSVSYCSNGDTVVAEYVGGVAELAALGAGSSLPVSSFRQSITHPDGTQTVSSAMADALMIRPVLTESWQLVMDNLPLLLEKSGADISMKDLGL